MNSRLLSLAVVLLALVACKEDKNPVAPPVDTTTPPPPPPPDTTPPPAIVATIMAAGSIAECVSNNDEATAQLIEADTGAIAVALGDNAFPNGTLTNYNDCYGPTWGRFKARTYAAVGNHEYDSSATAAGAVAFFGPDRIGPAGKNYYSFNAGTWHIIVLNVADFSGVSYLAGSEQLAWLTADLQANAAKKCVMAVWHNPRFLSSDTAGFTERTTQRALWQVLYDSGVDVVLNGGEHMYERMLPLNAAGQVDTVLGIRQFNSGVGGESRFTSDRLFIHPASAARGFDYGVLKLTLRSDSYSWQFLPVAGATFTDSGTGACR